jgi:hypothetical protein
MGYEVVYDPATGMWSIWSTVIDNWIKTGLKSPDEVGEWVAETIREPKCFAIVDEEGFIVLSAEGSLEFYGSYDTAQAFLPRTAKNLGIPPEKLKVVEADPSVYVAYIKSIWRLKAKEAKEGRKTGIEAIEIGIDPRTGRLYPIKRRVHKPPLESSSEVRGFESHTGSRVFEVKYWPKDKPEEAKVTYVKAESEEEAKGQIVKKGYEAEVTGSYSEEEWSRLVGLHTP